VGELISEDDPGSDSFVRARTWFGPSVTSTIAGDSVSARLTGTIDGGLNWLLRGRRVTALALEFGTQPSHKVLAALRKDNWLYAHGSPDHPDAPAIKAAIRAAFYVEADHWKTAILTRGREVVGEALAGLTC